MLNADWGGVAYTHKQPCEREFEENGEVQILKLSI